MVIAGDNVGIWGSPCFDENNRCELADRPNELLVVVLRFYLIAQGMRHEAFVDFLTVGAFSAFIGFDIVLVHEATTAVCLEGILSLRPSLCGWPTLTVERHANNNQVVLLQAND